MPRLILQLGSGAQAASIQASAMSVAGVQDAVEARQAEAVVVTVDRLSPQVRQELAGLPGVAGVFDDIQGVPQVADQEAVDDFLNRVRDLRGEDEVPPTIETKPLRSDGGAAVHPGPKQMGLRPQATGPISGASDSVYESGALDLHDRGVTGEDVIAVIVDTGVCGESFDESRQLEGADLSGQNDPWVPLADHGGMSAGIMAGGPETPGIDVGFLPGADVFPIKTSLAASELMQAQDVIVDLADQDNRTVVVNNSWGFTECAGLCDHPVTTSIESASARSNVIQVFSAGNQATECGRDCDGSQIGISGPNSLSNVISVAASGRDGHPTRLHPYSSRGGEGPVSCGQRKPDLSAPIYGQVPWGCGWTNLGNGGGTSGAAPQVAGAAGLVADINPRATTEDVLAALAGTAEQFTGDEFNGCSGRGNLRAAEAADAIEVPAPAAAGLAGTATLAGVALSIGVFGAALRETVDRLS